MSAPVVRFAPSPTGRLHIGNARTALFNWLFARQGQGTFILRLDDTDRARSTEAFAQGIVEDLAWLGILPDITFRQSDHFARYDAAADRLRAAGLLYPCYETEEELEYRRRRQLAQHRAPVYDRAALKLTEADRARLEGEGRKPHWRFLLDHRVVIWTDHVRGEQSIDCASLSDPVLIRGDGAYLYTLPSVADDIASGVTDVIRGEDHVTNTAVQIQLFERLGATVPRFGHHNLLTLPSGEGLSKRLGHLSLQALREDGYEPMAVAARAVLIGTSRSVEPVVSLDELGTHVTLADVSPSPAKFDPDDLRALNARTLHRLPYERVADRLAAAGIAGGAAFWDAVRANLTFFAEATEWWSIARGDGPVLAQPDEAAFLAEAAALLPAEPWDQETWARWTAALKESTGRKGRALFHPLRIALTGRETGPELKLFLPIMGRATCLRRLAAF